MISIVFALLSLNGFAQGLGEFVEKPQEPSTNLLFDADSDRDGICKAMGYEKSVIDKSTNKVIREEQNRQFQTVHVDASGKITKAIKAKQRRDDYYSNIAANIVCTGEQGEPESSYVVLRKEDLKTDNNIYFSIKTDFDGLCKYKKYASAVEGSEEEGYETSNNCSSLILDGSGNLTEKDNNRNCLVVRSLICKQ